jgi:hypothetical protein
MGGGGGGENPRAADWGGLGAEERKREKGGGGGAASGRIKNQLEAHGARFPEKDSFAPNPLGFACIRLEIEHIVFTSFVVSNASCIDNVDAKCTIYVYSEYVIKIVARY